MQQTINIFDLTKVIHNRKKAQKDFADASFLYELALSRLDERLDDINRTFETAVHFGVRDANLLSPLLEKNHYTALGDFDTLRLPDYQCFTYHDENIPLENGEHDLITSAVDWHWLNNLPLFFSMLNRKLKPNGLLLANMWGERTLKELRDAIIHAETEIKGGASMRVSPFVEVKTLGSLLQSSGFEHPITDLETIEIQYSSILKLCQDLRAMGGMSALAQPRTPISRRILYQAEQFLKENNSQDGNLFTITFELVSMTALATQGQ